MCVNCRWAPCPLYNHFILLMAILVNTCTVYCHKSIVAVNSSYNLCIDREWQFWLKMHIPDIPIKVWSKCKPISRKVLLNQTEERRGNLQLISATPFCCNGQWRATDRVSSKLINETHLLEFTNFDWLQIPKVTRI